MQENKSEAPKLRNQNLLQANELLEVKSNLKQKVKEVQEFTFLLDQKRVELDNIKKLVQESQESEKKQLLLKDEELKSA